MDITLDSALAAGQYTLVPSSGVPDTYKRAIVAVSQTSVVFDNLDTTMDAWMLSLGKVVSSAGADSLLMQISVDNGTTYPGGTAYYSTVLKANRGSVFAAAQSAQGGGQWFLNYQALPVSAGVVDIGGLGVGETRSFRSECVCFDGALQKSFGDLALTGAVNAIKIFPQGIGATISGRFTLYGAKEH